MPNVFLLAAQQSRLASAIGCFRRIPRARYSSESRVAAKSIFERNVKAATAAKEVIAICNSSSLPLLPGDATLFLNALIRLRGVRRTGKEFQHFTEKIIDTLQSTQDVAYLRNIFVKFSDLKASTGAKASLPFLTSSLSRMSAIDCAECIWAIATLFPVDADGAYRIFLAALLRRLEKLEDFDRLSPLTLYRIVYGLAKLDFRCSASSDLLQRLVSPIRRQLQDDSRKAFPARYVVRLFWSYGCFKISVPDLFRDFSATLQALIEDLTFEDAKLIKETSQLLLFRDEQLLTALSDLEENFCEFGTPSPVTAPRKRPFKKKEKRVTVWDPFPARKV